MAIRTESYSEIAVDGRHKELEALQAILTSQGESVSYEEAADIGYELLGFFEALGEDNEQTKDSHA